MIFVCYSLKPAKSLLFGPFVPCRGRQGCSVPAGLSHQYFVGTLGDDACVRFQLWPFLLDGIFSTLECRPLHGDMSFYYWIIAWGECTSRCPNLIIKISWTVSGPVAVRAKESDQMGKLGASFSPSLHCLSLGQWSVCIICDYIIPSFDQSGTSWLSYFIAVSRRALPLWTCGYIAPLSLYLYKMSVCREQDDKTYWILM